MERIQLSVMGPRPLCSVCLEPLLGFFIHSVKSGLLYSQEPEKTRHFTIHQLLNCCSATHYTYCHQCHVEVLKAHMVRLTLGKNGASQMAH